MLICFDAAAAECEIPPAPGLSWVVLRADRPGASAARNMGWRAAAAPLVLFLDDDIVPGRRLIAEHLAWHRSRPQPEIGVLGLVRWADEVRVTPFMRWLERGVLFDFASIAGDEAGWGRFYSCNVSVKRAMLARVGGFDEQEFPFLYEDLDLGRRMSAHGFRLLYNRGAAAEHLKTETPDSWEGRLALIAASEYRFIRRYPSERPYFYDRFRAAVQGAPPRGIGAALARFVPPRVPVLGPRVWASYDAVWWRRLAPAFLAAWKTAGR